MINKSCTFRIAPLLRKVRLAPICLLDSFLMDWNVGRTWEELFRSSLGTDWSCFPGTWALPAPRASEWVRGAGTWTPASSSTCPLCEVCLASVRGRAPGPGEGNIGFRREGNLDFQRCKEVGGAGSSAPSYLRNNSPERGLRFL